MIESVVIDSTSDQPASFAEVAAVSELEIGVAHSRSRALSTLTPESKNPVLRDAELVQQVDKLLKALELLFEQGEVETAETQYVEFLKDCQCDLPETLDQAIKEWQASKP